LYYFKIRKYFSYFFKFIGFLFLVLVLYILSNSALDIYNNFAYEKAILVENPYGYAPLLQDPKFYTSGTKDVLCGEYVYVKDWLSAYNGDIIFAKVRYKLNEGYINRDLLVETNINIKPIFSVLCLLFMFVYSFKKLYYKFIIN